MSYGSQVEELSASRTRIYLCSALGVALIAVGLGYWWLNSFTVDFKNFSSAPVTVSAMRAGWWPSAAQSPQLKPYGAGGTALIMDAIDHRSQVALELVLHGASGSQQKSCMLKKDGHRWCRFEVHLVTSGELIYFPCEPFI